MMNEQPREQGIVRVFISSTFRDMHAERDHLVTVVFPELRERVETLGLEFFDVDLRWGVPAKDANGETANSWEYCRQWIDRVEPFFVGILGQRYGWVPAPQQFRAPADQQRQEHEARSITDLEVRHAVLDNRRKRRSYFYLRQTLVPVLPPDTTEEEREVYGEFVDPPPVSGMLDQLKTAVRQCGRPARNYQCRWIGRGFAEMEEFGRLVLDDLWSGVLRDERYVNKEVWRQVLNVDPDTDPRYTDETQPVPRELWEKIVAKARPAPVSPLDAERQQMEAFATTRLRWFQGRTHELQQLTDFLASTDENSPCLAVVAAMPGQGKSALLAQLSTRVPQSSTYLITHFVGATERSTTAYAVVERLLGELEQSRITWPEDENKKGAEPKRDFNSLCNRLAQWLGDYAGERRIVILLDALNQLTDGHDLHWLPSRLGPRVRIVVSCVENAAAKADSPEQRVLHALASRQSAPLRVPLGLLTEIDVRSLVVEYLKEYCHELDHEHLATLCAIPQVRNPLYLLVMLNELRTLGGNDLNRIVPALISAMPQEHPDTVSLFHWVLQRLEVFGTKAVCWWCRYLIHGRVGMASHELADLLGRKLGAHAAATALRIERGLRRYLLRRGGQLDFFHGQLRQAVMERYGPKTEPAVAHDEMADYFTTCARGDDPRKEWETDSIRGFAECVFHLTKAGQHDQAAGLLSNFPFLLHKLRMGLLEGVFEDYEMVRRAAPVEVARLLEIWPAFFRDKAHLLRRGNDEWPAYKILLQLAVEHADDSPLTMGAEEWLARDRCHWLWLRRIPRSAHYKKNPCLAVFDGHTSGINGVWQLDAGRLLSWSKDHTLRVWDIEHGTCLKILRGHSDNVKGVLILPGGRLLSWACGESEREYTLRIWEGQSGVCLQVLEGHTGHVKGVLKLAAGQLLSWSDDKTMRVWDEQHGVCLRVLEGHTWGIKGALELRDGCLVSWSDDRTMRMWDEQHGVCLRVLEGHTGGIDGAFELRDGHLVSWANRTLRVWDVHSGECLRILAGHAGSIHHALELRSGRLLSWCGEETRVWDASSGVCLGVIDGPAGDINGALELSDGRLLLWNDQGILVIGDNLQLTSSLVLHGHASSVIGALELSDGRLLSWDFLGVLRVWDRHDGICLAVLENRTASISNVRELTDGRVVSWDNRGWDRTIQLWDTWSTATWTMPDSHTSYVSGVLGLGDGRLLSWGGDATLRLWDMQSGGCLHVLTGHAGPIKGALELSDGRLVSWSRDATLQVWDTQTGVCQQVIEGPAHRICCALEMDGHLIALDNRLVSDHQDQLLVWDILNGSCLDVISAEQFNTRQSAWHDALQRAKNAKTPRMTVGGFDPYFTRHCILSHQACTYELAAWESDYSGEVPFLRLDGMLVATLLNQVCILKLYHGQQRISLAEVEAQLTAQGELTGWYELQQHAESTGGNGYLYLTRDVDSRKSNILVCFLRDYPKTHPHNIVIPHFIFAYSYSTDMRQIIRSLCCKLVTSARLAMEIPEDPEQLRVAFAEILQQASARKRVIILLEVTDQYDSTTRQADWTWWLPAELPATARIVISTLSGAALDSLL